MDSNILKALNVAKEIMPDYQMLKCYDYGNCYYFSCMKDNEMRNGPCIDKQTFKRLNISSAELMLFNNYINEVDLKKEGYIS